ncbi:hypothetical protein GQ55_1G064900 [Panicum hallii var. hallii]|uniref:Uncharacterized protein n=1 Tax=Panicum hallii var. hallii TaxID=1504633 RepID=A0A2T7F2X6_9POAL|nr:hypothetical protein GQ55_1G064900 [Panicum hallii var. hallii]
MTPPAASQQPLHNSIASTWPKLLYHISPTSSLAWESYLDNLRPTGLSCLWLATGRWVRTKISIDHRLRDSFVFFLLEIYGLPWDHLWKRSCDER